jgi:hypothetical protein
MTDRSAEERAIEEKRRTLDYLASGRVAAADLTSAQARQENPASQIGRRHPVLTFLLFVASLGAGAGIGDTFSSEPLVLAAFGWVGGLILFALVRAESA